MSGFFTRGIDVQPVNLVISSISARTRRTFGEAAWGPLPMSGQGINFVTYGRSNPYRRGWIGPCWSHSRIKKEEKELGSGLQPIPTSMQPQIDTETRSGMRLALA